MKISNTTKLFDIDTHLPAMIVFPRAIINSRIARSKNKKGGEEANKQALKYLNTNKTPKLIGWNKYYKRILNYYQSGESVSSIIRLIKLEFPTDMEIADSNGDTVKHLLEYWHLHFSHNIEEYCSLVGIAIDSSSIQGNSIINLIKYGEEEYMKSHKLNEEIITHYKINVKGLGVEVYQPNYFGVEMDISNIKPPSIEDKTDDYLLEIKHYFDVQKRYKTISKEDLDLLVKIHNDSISLDNYLSNLQHKCDIIIDDLFEQLSYNHITKEDYLNKITKAILYKNQINEIRSDRLSKKVN